MSASIIIAEGLTKDYAEKRAVDGLDFSVEPGEVVGLLGPNGAGKTTTILMLLGLTEPSEGRALVAGFDPLRQPLEVKRRTGYMPDAVGFYDNLSARENLIYTAKLADIPRPEIAPRLDQAMARVGLSDVAEDRVKTFSRGMRQRLAIAEILMKRAEIAILDEPTGGLDPQSTREFLDLVRALKRDGMTILLSSHLLDLVQSVCDRVALFHQGRIGLMGRVETLLQDVLGGAYVVRLETQGRPTPALKERLATLQGIVGVAAEGEHGLRIEAARDLRPAIARCALDAGAELTGLSLGRASLDDVYRTYFSGLDKDKEVRDAA